LIWAIVELIEVDYDWSMNGQGARETVWFEKLAGQRRNSGGVTSILRERLLFDTLHKPTALDADGQVVFKGNC
jgi:hypothetical protein